MSNEQTSEVRKTSADIKKDIEKAREELKTSSIPVTGMIAQEINAHSNSTTETPAKANVTPQPVINQAANGAEGAEPTKESVDLKEWAAKKGITWTDDNSILAALRKSDQLFTEKRMKDKADNPQAPPYAAPAYTPPPSQGSPYPGYYPPQPPINNRSMLENVARQYNMTPEDAERLMAFNRDYYEAVSRGDKERTQKELDSIRKENQKNSVFRELSIDPVFKRPEVAREFYTVLEEMQSRDPQSFEQDPNAYIRVYDKALVNIARRNLEGQPLQEGVPPIPRPPLTPPKPLGKGSGGGALDNENGINAQEFARLPLEEKRKILEKAGLRPAY